ncbi:MAG: ferritin-like domain-containing protein [Eubacteriales bacterium]
MEVDDSQLLKELNKILFLEHAHLGLYKSQVHLVRDQDIKRAFSRFMEMEDDHIERLRDIIITLDGKPGAISEIGDPAGKILGVSVDLSGTFNMLRADYFIEKKSFEGYTNLIAQISDRKVADLVAVNSLEAHLMELWLEERVAMLKAGRGEERTV